MIHCSFWEWEVLWNLLSSNWINIWFLWSFLFFFYLKETLPTETGEIVDTKQSTTDNRQDGTQQELALVQPSIPQVIISVTDDDFRPDNTDNQSFISTTTECDSVIENPMDSVKAGEKLTEDPSETTDSERSDLSEDISEDTVVVETTKVTSEEFDPGTTSVTVVTQTTVTEVSLSVYYLVMFDIVCIVRIL